MNLFDILMHAYIKTVPQFMWAPCGWASLRLDFIHTEIFGPCGTQVEKV